jgi:para-nitrobenzyl esterase
MRSYVSMMAIVAAIGLAAPTFAQSPPPLDPDPGAELIATKTIPAKGSLKVTTPGWKNNEDIPFKYTQYQGNNFPGLEWSKGPRKTKSYAIVMQDSGGVRAGQPILHWTMVNISPKTTKLPEGMKPEEKPAGSIYGPNIRSAAQPYMGPRTPPGPKHRYHLQVLALNTMLPADFAAKNYDELIAAIKDHVIASGSVVGLGQVDPSAPPRPQPATPPPAAPAP